MELHKDCTRQTRIVRRYSTNLVVRWIPCTERDEENGITQEGDYNNPIPYSGRYAVYEIVQDRKLKRTVEELLYIAENSDGSYRDIHENIDCVKLSNMDITKKGLINCDNYNQMREVAVRNDELKRKRDAAVRELDREKAKDMWRFVTDTPVISVGDKSYLK